MQYSFMSAPFFHYNHRKPQLSIFQQNEPSANSFPKTLMRCIPTFIVSPDIRIPVQSRRRIRLNQIPPVLARPRRLHDPSVARAAMFLRPAGWRERFTAPAYLISGFHCSIHHRMDCHRQSARFRVVNRQHNTCIEYRALHRALFHPSQSLRSGRSSPQI